MPQTQPPAGFASSKLHLHTVKAGEAFGRIYLAQFSDPLGYGKTPSRFSDPRKRIPENRFGVLYLGETVKVCFLEAVLRDQRDGLIDVLPIAEAELDNRHYADIVAAEDLTLVDLRGDGPVVMGVPTDVPRGARHTLSRKWSVAFHNHDLRPDGIIYPSRLNGHTNLAIYGRAITKLQTTRKRWLKAAPGLAQVLEDLQVAIAQPD